ncbi:hypothetical protein D3C86_2199170 [compost metagenome]
MIVDVELFQPLKRAIRVVCPAGNDGGHPVRAAPEVAGPGMGEGVAVQFKAGRKNRGEFVLIDTGRTYDRLVHHRAV